MKLILAIMTLLAVSAEAAIQFQNSAGANLGVRSRVQCGSNMTCTQSGGKVTIGVGTANASLVGDGTAIVVRGFRQSQLPSSSVASLTPSTSYCGATIVSNGAHVVNLPEASTVLGCRFTFVCGVASNLDINPADGTDAIANFNYASSTSTAQLSPSAGDAVRCSTIGASLTIEAIGNDLWAVIGVANGTWSDVN